MFVRYVKNKNGRVYVQVVSKSTGRYKVLQSFGSARSDEELKSLTQEAHRWIKSASGRAEFDFENEISLFEKLLKNITAHKLAGIDLVLGGIFDEIGFNQIKDELFKDLVLYRLVYPGSKLKTTEYLYRYAGKEYSEDDIYRYLDKLHHSQIYQIEITAPATKGKIVKTLLLTEGQKALRELFDFGC